MSNNAIETDEEAQKKLVWFNTYFDRISNTAPSEPALVHPTTGKNLYRCPCCGCPTLDERSGYEICDLCGWEDDGQDDPHADEVWGGPNKNYSLTEARQNFTLYGIKYRLGGDKRLGGPDTDAERQAKHQIMQSFDAMHTVDLDDAARALLWQAVDEGRDILYKELVRKIREYTASMERAREY